MTQRDNVKAGLFVIVGLAMGLVVIFLLADFGRLFEGTQRVRVFYHLDDGLGGLRVGAPVTLGNVPVGEVTQIEEVFEVVDGQDRVVGMIVHLKLPERYPLYQDAIIELQTPYIGTGTKLNIRNVGSGRQRHGPLDAPIEGGLAGSELTQSLIRDAGIGEQQRREIQNILANVEVLTGTLREDIPAITSSARETIDRIGPLVEDAATAVANFQRTVADVQAITNAARDRSGLWFDRLDRISESADATLATVNELVQDKRPALAELADNMQQLSATLNDQTLPRLNQTLDNTQALTGEARAILVSQRPVIERAVANLQLTGSQLMLAAIEVRRSPWRLLYRPSNREVAHDNLYDAARSFALAASAIDSTAASLRAIVDQHGEEAEVRRLLEYLESVVSRFEEVEQQFWQRVEQP